MEKKIDEVENKMMEKPVENKAIKRDSTGRRVSANGKTQLKNASPQTPWYNPDDVVVFTSTDLRSVKHPIDNEVREYNDDGKAWARYPHLKFLQKNLTLEEKRQLAYIQSRKGKQQ